VLTKVPHHHHILVVVHHAHRVLTLTGACVFATLSWPMQAPAFTKYPIPENGPAIVKHAIHFLYGPEGPVAKASHMFNMLRLLVTLK
jgi:hypothetical protein